MWGSDSGSMWTGPLTNGGKISTLSVVNIYNMYCMLGSHSLGHDYRIKTVGETSLLYEQKSRY